MINRVSDFAANPLAFRAQEQQEKEEREAKKEEAEAERRKRAARKWYQRRSPRALLVGAGKQIELKARQTR